MQSITLDFINLIWRTGRIPTLWKRAIIIAIPKPGKDPTNVTSYRPISLTNTICKVMETMVNNRLKHHLEQNQLLAETQSGFRNKRSTLDQLIRLEANIKLAFNAKRKRDRHLVAIFLDLEKAFDLVWTNGLISQLNQFGITGRMHRWIANFLTGRTFKTRVREALSQTYTLDNGTPQGSVISPTLFNLMVNNLTYYLKNCPVDLSQFADDSSIWQAGNPNSQKNITQIQKGLDIIGTWANNWGFKISQIKTVAMLFSPTNKRPIYPKLYIQNQLIEFQKETYFLGMLLNETINWKPHIQQTIQKCQKDLNILKNIKGTTWGADQQTMLMIYKSLIRAKIDYGCQIYSSANKETLKQLDSIQYRALRLCTGALPNTSLEELQILACEPPLQLRREEHILRYACRISIHKDINPTRKIISKCQTTFSARLVPHPPAANKIHTLCKELNQIELQAEQLLIKDTTPWRNNQPNINLTALQLVHKRDNPNITLTQVQSLVDNNYDGYVKIYTDGSKSKELHRTAAAVVIPEHQITFTTRLPDDCSIYTAEFWAINRALKWIVTQNQKQYVIITDSLSVLESIETGNSKSRQNLLEDTMLTIREADKSNQTIHFLWVPSHINLPGNEKADQAAKSSLMKDQIEPVQYNIQELYSQVRDRINNKWQQQWENSTKGRHLFRLQKEVTRTQRLPKSLAAIDIKIINRIRTGKTLLNGSFMKHISTGPTPDKCPHCPETETLEHVFNICHKYHQQRTVFQLQQRKLDSVTSFPKILDTKYNKNVNTTYINILKYLKSIDKQHKI